MSQELEVTREYVKCLAKGLDPFTKEKLPEDTILNDITLSRCFFYVSDVLDQIEISSGSYVKYKENSVKEFALTDAMKSQLPFSESVTITEFTRRINKWASECNRKRLAYSKITAWLVKQEYLKDVVEKDGKKRRTPTEQGFEVGLLTEVRRGMYTDYEVILYTPRAQQMLCDNMELILQ